MLTWSAAVVSQLWVVRRTISYYFKLYNAFEKRSTNINHLCITKIRTTFDTYNYSGESIALARIYKLYFGDTSVGRNIKLQDCKWVIYRRKLNEREKHRIVTWNHIIQSETALCTNLCECTCWVIIESIFKIYANAVTSVDYSFKRLK